MYPTTLFVIHEIVYSVSSLYTVSFIAGFYKCVGSTYCEINGIYTQKKI